MEKPKTTPKDFFLWAGAMVALYVGVFNYIALVWDYINYAIPNPLQPYYGDPYQNGISWEMATLIVLAPVFLLLMWLIRRDIVKDATRREVWVRRWAIFFTLFVAGVTMVGDLIYVLYAFLNGTDLTAAFLLKALVVLLVASVGFMHFIADLWGFWEQYPSRNRMVAGATLALVLLTIVAGFFIVGTPQHARLVRFDQQKVTDLQSIQSQVISYYQAKQALPNALNDLANSLSYFTVPTDAQSGETYGYQVTKPPYTFELCADFNLAGDSSGPDMYQTAPATSRSTDNWQHPAGQQCFTRTIDPQMYPPANGLMIPAPAKVTQ